MSSTAGTKRRAPWADQPTLAPRMRGPMPQVTVNQFAMSQPASPQTAPIAMPLTPELSPSQRAAGGPVNKSARDLANEQLRKVLSERTQGEAIDLLMALANRDVGIRSAIESENRKIVEAAGGERRKAKAKKKTPSLNFDKLLKRVEAYMYKETPFSWGRGREMSEACRVTNGIEKIFAQLVEHCAEDSPSEIKCGTMVAVSTIWDIVIFAPCSMTRRQCLMDSVMWEKPTLTIWNRMNHLEKKAFASHSGVVESLVKTAIEWKNHCQREALFKHWLKQMKTAADGAMGPEYAKWEIQNDPRTPQSQGLDAAPSSPPIINLTLD